MTPTEKPNVPFTKERFYMDHVGGHGIPALRRHVNRYKWAASHVPQGSSVLDAGCGSGYGDHILLNMAATVSGVPNPFPFLTRALVSRLRFSHV